jgi:3-isopropylmalate dehydrogenase
MSKKILVIPGDGIGPEIVEQGVAVLKALQKHHGLDIEFDSALLGGAAVDATGDPFPKETEAKALAADAILFGAVGGAKWDVLPRAQRPESGLLRIRTVLGLFANLRPAILYPELAQASTLKHEVVAGLDIMIVRELTGDIYFGQPRKIERSDKGDGRAFNTMVYSEAEIERIVRVACDIAMLRGRKLCSVDKANVLEVSELWREVATRVVSREYPEIKLSHMYVDNAAMQLVRAPKQFDVVVTGNIFGDILSDIAAQLTGSIGMLPSASLSTGSKGLYEPIHGSAPDIAGRGIANPLATILSVAMMLRYSLGRPELARKVETAVGDVLRRGLRTADIANGEQQTAGTAEIGGAVVDLLA